MMNNNLFISRATQTKNMIRDSEPLLSTVNFRIDIGYGLLNVLR